MQEAYLSKTHTILDIKLEPEEQYDLILVFKYSDLFYNLGKHLTNKQKKVEQEKSRKANEWKAAQAAKKAAEEEAKKAAKAAKKAKGEKKGEKKDKSGKEGNKGEKVKQESKNAEIVNEPANEKGKKEVEQNIKKETSSTTKEAPATPKEEKTKN